MWRYYSAFSSAVAKGLNLKKYITHWSRNLIGILIDGNPRFWSPKLANETKSELRYQYFTHSFEEIIVYLYSGQWITSYRFALSRNASNPPTLTRLAGMRQRMGKWKYRSCIKYAGQLFSRLSAISERKFLLIIIKIPVECLKFIAIFFLKQTNYFLLLATSKSKLRYKAAIWTAKVIEKSRIIFLLHIFEHIENFKF